MNAPPQRTIVDRMEPLLSGAELLRAIRGDRVGDHPLARWACLLAGVHRAAMLAREEAVVAPENGGERGSLVHAIDVWTEQQVPQHHQGVALHTETLGSVIDRIADAQVHADAMLMTCTNAGDPRVHAAWFRLAELVDGYNDLAAQVVDGVRRLPVPAGRAGDRAASRMHAAGQRFVAGGVPRPAQGRQPDPDRGW